MKKNFLVIMSLLSGVVASAQFTYKIKADTLLVTNDSCSAEFALENASKDTKGFLYNYNKGRTKFVPALTKINDTTYIIGVDTMKLRATSVDAWRLNGNTGINPANTFLGSIDEQPLVIKTGNVQRMRINPVVDANTAGEVLIGLGVPNNSFSLTVRESGAGRAGILIDGTNSSPNPSLTIYSGNPAHYHTGLALSSAIWGNSGLHQYEGLTYWVDSNRVFRWLINSQEKMRVNQNGELTVNSLSDAGDYKLQVTGNTWSNGYYRFYNGAAFAPNVKIGYDGTNTHAIHINGADIAAPAVKIDNIVYGGYGGVIDITSNSGYNYAWGGDGTGAALRYIKTAANGGGLANYGGTYTDHQVHNNSNAEVLYGHYTKTRNGTSPGYSYYADAQPLSGGTGTAYAFYANAGKSYFKDKLTLDGPNGYSQLQLAQTYTPSATGDSNGQTGDVAWDGSYIYIKTASGWKRASLSTF